MQNHSTKRVIQISVPYTGEEEWMACREPLMNGWLTQGPLVAAFERAFAERHAVKHALAVTSCTTGLHLALLGLGIGPGDEVIVPAFTWVATANAVLYCGANPIFVDVSRETYNIAIDEVAKKVTAKTRAVIAVHLFGLPVDTDALRAALPKHVAVVEDAACAAGASLRGQHVGGLGEVAAFSFHPRKSVTTGEGGMVTTNDPELAERINRLRNHGASISEEQRHHGPRPYLLADFDVLGYNYRMTDLQAAVGGVQLKKLDVFMDERSRWAEWYSERLQGIPWLCTPRTFSTSKHGWQAYVTYVDPRRAPMPRNEIMQRLQELGISTRPGTHAVHMLGYYRNRFALEADDFPAARDCNDHTMAIPLHNRMTSEDYEYVLSALQGLA